MSKGLLGRLLAPNWTFASEGLTSQVFSLARVSLRDALVPVMGATEADAVYHAFVVSLVEAVGAIVDMRRSIKQILSRYYSRGRGHDNFQLRKVLLSFADARFKHRFTGLLVRLADWSNGAVLRAVVAACALHEARRKHKVPEYLLQAHALAMEHHFLSHVLCQYPAEATAESVPREYVIGDALTGALSPWLPSDLPDGVTQQIARLRGAVHEEHKDDGEGDEGQAVSGRFAPNRVCLWNLCDDGTGTEITWLRTILRNPVECTREPPDGLAHVVAMACVPESAPGAAALAVRMAKRVRDCTQTLTVLLVSAETDASTDPVDDMQPCLRYTDQLGLCLSEALRRRGLFNLRVHLEMIWATGSNAPVQTLLQDGDEWWQHEADHATNPMVKTFLTARCGPWIAGIHIALAPGFHEGVKHSLVALVNDSALNRVVLTDAYEPYHTVVVISSLATRAERDAYRAQHLAQHSGTIVWVVALLASQMCLSCDATEPNVAALCAVPMEGTSVDIATLLTLPCNVRALQILRRALGGMDD